jgi:hypothetical protein
MKKMVLKIDGFFLVIMGTLAGVTDLVSYFAGKGPFGDIYYQNSIAIGGFEAHCLALIAGSVLVVKSKSPDAIFFNKVGAFIHTSLGISNLIWFNIFLETDTIPMGYITTFAHFLFILLNIIATLKTKKPGYITT